MCRNMSPLLIGNKLVVFGLNLVLEYVNNKFKKVHSDTLSEQCFTRRNILQLTIEHLAFTKDTFIQTSLFREGKFICSFV
jgi:hypothetical protein